VRRKICFFLSSFRGAVFYIFIKSIMAHYGVRCDGCAIRDYTGVRYKCQHCADYDLCHNCMINGVISNQHLTSHPMKSIVAQGELDLYFGGGGGGGGDSSTSTTRKKARKKIRP